MWCKNKKPLGVEKTDTTQLKIQLIPVYGLSIPVIIRTGEVKVTSTISDLKLETLQDTVHNLKFSINRSGNLSAYGDIIVQFIPTTGKAFDIGKIKGIGVYTTTNKRNVTMRLNSISNNALKNGKIKLQFISNDATQKTPTVFAESELEIK